MEGTPRNRARGEFIGYAMNILIQTELTLKQPQPLGQDPAAIYIASLHAETGRRTQAQALRVIAHVLGVDYDRLNWGALRYRHTAAVYARIVQVYSPTTANRILSALRQTLKQAWLLGQMTAEDYRLAVELEPVTGKAVLARRELSTGEILALMTTCQKNKDDIEGTRDAAIIGIMYAAGLRRNEVVGLSVGCYDPETGKLFFTSKWNKQRTVYITNGAAQALNDWLPIRGNEPGALFVEVTTGQKVLTQREEMIVKRFRKNAGVKLPDKKAGQKIYKGSAMTTQEIYNMLTKRAAAASLRNFSPQDMRRTFILKTKQP
jgi:integrase/recombinase XerD